MHREDAEAPSVCIWYLIEVGRLNSVEASWLNEVVGPQWNLKVLSRVQIVVSETQLEGSVKVPEPTIKDRNDGLAGCPQVT
jgi:hypothetical protein